VPHLGSATGHCDRDIGILQFFVPYTSHGGALMTAIIPPTCLHQRTAQLKYLWLGDQQHSHCQGSAGSGGCGSYCTHHPCQSQEASASGRHPASLLHWMAGSHDHACCCVVKYKYQV
jgi:hypothetical protein